MAFNLIRNAKVFFTTNVNSFGVIYDGASSAFAANNTWEIQVLDGLSFSQNTTTETIGLNEAGTTPKRGQRNFNTALEPVDFSFSTYIRPRDIQAGTAAATNSHQVTAEERHLWNAMFGYANISAGTGSGAAWADSAVNDIPATNYANVLLTNSGRNQLVAFGLIICMDDATFYIDNCVMDTATIDFGLDTIAAIQWAGKAGAIRQLGKTVIGAPSAGTSTVTAGSVVSGVTTSTFTGAVAAKDTNAAYLANKLSSVALGTGITAVGTAGTIGTLYNIALTGGSVSIANNVTYLTPANLGVVNTPIVYFTGTRSITGSMNAYLRTGANSTTALYNALLTASKTDVNPAFNLKMSIGGSSTTSTRVDLLMPAVVLQIPTIATEQVISTTIGFTAQGSSGSAFDIEQDNELEIRYYVADTDASGI
jgi:hypothetical protein